MGPCDGDCQRFSPVEEASAQELSNIVIRDSPEDAPMMDCFGEHREECSAEAPADTFHMDAALHGEESMEQTPKSDLGQEGSKSSKESDSSKSTPCHYFSRCCCPNSISWADEDQEEGEEQEETQGEEQLTPPASQQGKPAEEHVEELPVLEQKSLGTVPS